MQCQLHLTYFIYLFLEAKGQCPSLPCLIYFFPVWLRNRLKSAGLEPVLSYTKKAGIALYYRYFFTNIKIKIIKLLPVLLANAFGPRD